MQNSWGLLSILALPAIASMYWLQPRARVRRIGGLFLWTEIAQAPAGNRVPKRGLSVILDLLTAGLLVALACGLISRNSESDLHGTWLGAGVRFVLCVAITALLIYAWRSTASTKTPH